ncbi:MAG: response regulator [bacterium]
MEILIVEDNPGLGRDLQALLEHLGYHAPVVAPTLKEAEEVFDGRRFDLILLDLRLPDGNGLELIRKLRQRGVRTMFIVCSGAGQLEDAAEAMELGGLGYVFKSRLTDKLIQLLQEAEERLRRAPVSHPIVHEHYWHTYVVALMQATVRCWILESRTNLASLADQSGQWRVSIDRDTPRARTLERYLRIESLPGRPRMKPVIKTAEYVLNRFPRSLYALEIRVQLELVKQKLQPAKR